MIRCSVTSARSADHKGTRPAASSGSASKVTSAYPQPRRQSPTRSSRDSLAAAHMSPFEKASSSGQGSGSGNGRPNASPKYPRSTPARCLTIPSRLVPVGVIGRRTSYSLSPSSFHSIASRASWRYRRRTALGSLSVMTASVARGTDSPSGSAAADDDGPVCDRQVHPSQGDLGDRMGEQVAVEDDKVGPLARLDRAHLRLGMVDPGRAD